jgi:hypothetical protein
LRSLVALRAALLVLLLIAVAWFIRTRRLGERRLWPIGIALVAGLALLSRRVGWGELLLIVAVIVIPAILFAPRPR